MALAKRFLETGEVIGIPTETVYGLAGNALDEEAVLKIFSVKSRPHFDPLIVHTYSIERIKTFAEDIPEKALELMQKFMPGPITVLLKKKPVIPDLVTSGLDTVAVRIPAHPLALQLLETLSFPLAAPSANPFGYISPTTAQHVYDQLNHKIPYVLDGGPAHVGLESTIIGFENDEPLIYRPGGLALEEIEKVIGKVRVIQTSGSNPRSPGLLNSHYAPLKPLRFGKPEFIKEQIDVGRDKSFMVICFNEYLEGISKTNQILVSPAGDLQEAAKTLFAVLRRLDKSEAEVLFALEFPAKGLGVAINDRLKRASSKH
jgi:L-threonylcarbamoyladenylate synthase